MVQLLKKLVWAVMALIGGRITGRPCSGRWLAHYFVGGGEEMRLPRRMEEQVLASCLAGRSKYDGRSREVEYLPQDQGPFYVTAPSGDAYTTVGELVVWQNGEFLHYLDVYDWHPDSGWEFTVESKFLPTVAITGSDDIWNEVASGTEFVTRGRIRMDADVPAHSDSPCYYGNIKLIKLNHLLERWGLFSGM